MAGRFIGFVAALLCLLFLLFLSCCCVFMPPFVFRGTINSTEFEVPCRAGGSHASRPIAIAGFYGSYVMDVVCLWGKTSDLGRVN